MKNKWQWVILGALFLAFQSVTPVFADIYMYEDNEGVIHFTRSPSKRGSKMFIRHIDEDRNTKSRPRSASRPVRYRSAGYAARDMKKFEPIIDTFAEEYGVDKALVKAMIHVESGYNPSAVSPKGAVGLMQLMPETARGLSVVNSFDPVQNIRGGVRYMRFLLDSFGGNVRLALAAYNAGPSKVNRYGGVPPYGETHNYIAGVMNYRERYRSN